MTTVQRNETASPDDHGVLADTTRPTVRFEGVGKQFDDEWVLRGIDLSIDPGIVFGMIGPSGCGKTTTVRLALGSYWPDEGQVRLRGSDPVTRSVSERKTVGYLPQHPVLFDELTLWQNLQYHASISGMTFRRRERLNEMLELVDLLDDRKKRVSQASGGMKRRLALAATLVHDPPVLVLDEPTAGIDPILRAQLWDEFRRLRDAGTTLIVTTQFVEEAAYCDEVAILAHGGIQSVGRPEELVTTAYGGRRFDLHFDRLVGGRMIDALEQDDSVVTATGVTDRVIRVVAHADTLDDGDPDDGADDGRTRLVEQLETRVGDASISSVSEVPVEWNDVFAKIVGRSADDADAVVDADADADVDTDTDTDAGSAEGGDRDA